MGTRGGRRSRLRAAVGIVVSVISIATAAHVTFAFEGPGTDVGRIGAQTAWLDGQLKGGAGPRMQGLFPEGDYFTNVLTGIAAARVAGQVQGTDRETQLRLARETLAELDAPRNTDLFRGISSPPEGVFFRGWRLLLLTEIARVSLTTTDRESVRTEAATLQSAFAASPTGLLESYPNSYWACDNVVGMAALVRANTLLGVAGPRAIAAAWLTRTHHLRDVATGLFPHRTRADGTAAEGPRGSSQALIQTFMPDLAPSEAGGEWTAYTKLFVVREAGLVGVREHPIGSVGSGDEDSGPLVLGVSLSASAVTLAAARANGDTALANTLDREAETFGVGLQWGGERRYALGQLPVGDAWLAWARSTPLADTSVDSGSPNAWWWAYALGALVPAGLVGALVLRGRRRASARSGPKASR